MELLVVAAVIVFVVIGILGKANKGKRGERNPIKGRRVLTMNEQPTFLRLREALPEHFVLAQVAFSAFMTAKGYPTRNLFNRKVADFVVLDKSFNVIAIVELDDSSHKGKEDKDAERDDLIKEAGYKVIRYKRTPDIAQIKSDFGLISNNISEPQRLTNIEIALQKPIEQNEPKTRLISDAIIVETDKSENLEKTDKQDS